MSSQKNQIDRKVRIELLRAHADLERKELCYLSQQIGSSLQPSSILTGLKGQLFHGLIAPEVVVPIEKEIIIHLVKCCFNMIIQVSVRMSILCCYSWMKPVIFIWITYE